MKTTLRATFLTLALVCGAAACGSDAPENKPANTTPPTEAMTDSTEAMTDSTEAMTESTQAMSDTTGG